MKTLRTALVAGVGLLALGLGNALAAGDHDMGTMSGDTMSADMKAMHEELEAKMADTSAFGEKGDPARATETVKVEASEIKFDITELTVTAGTTVKFVVTNKGEQAHEFTVGDAAYEEAASQMMAMMTDMKMDPAAPEHAAMHAAAGNTVIVQPNETKEFAWTFTKTGTFAFACNFVGHSEAGMIGTITVK